MPPNSRAKAMVHDGNAMTFLDILEFCFQKPTAAEASGFHDTVTECNLHRARILAVLIIVISVILMAVDCLVMNGVKGSINLRVAAIVSRFALIVFLVVFLIDTRRPPPEGFLHHRVWDVAFTGISLAWFSLFSGALLVVRPGIEPYLITVFTIAAFFILGVLRSALTFGIGLALFSLSVAASHPDQRLLLSALVNGFIATLLAFIISRATFVMRLREYRNNAYQADQQRELLESNERLQRLSFVDPLTNIANRRFLEMSISREWKLHARSGFQMSVLMIDIDWFKSFNDNYGHLAGDECLRQVATALENTVRRPTDLVTRYGGEEFCVLLPMTKKEGAICIVKRMMRAINCLDIPHRGSPLGSVTVSMGIASCLPDHVSGFDDLLRSADTALYNAKISGKNRIAWCCPLLLLKKENDGVNNLTRNMSLSTNIPLEQEFDASPEVS
jgi:diguanylate cyclase (GGDEF)-like protein